MADAINDLHSADGGGTPSATANALVRFAMAITCSSSACISGVRPFAFAEAVWLCTQ